MSVHFLGNDKDGFLLHVKNQLPQSLPNIQLTLLLSKGECCTLSETTKTISRRKPCRKRKTGYIFFWSGRKHGKCREAGVGFANQVNPVPQSVLQYTHGNAAASCKHQISNNHRSTHASTITNPVDVKNNCTRNLFPSSQPYPKGTNFPSLVTSMPELDETRKYGRVSLANMAPANAIVMVFYFLQHNFLYRQPAQGNLNTR